MKHLMNFYSIAVRGFVAVFLFGLVCTAAAQPKSDYEIVKSFQAKYKAIREAIREAKTVQDCAAINADISELEQQYAIDTTLLNRALYPNNYDTEISNARVDLGLAQSKLGLIESQVALITSLEAQVRVLSGKVDSLTAENNKLMASLDVMSKALVTNTKTIDSLKKIIGRLREGLRARDAAIFAMVDSMFLQYGKNIQGLPDEQKKMLVGKMERHDVVTEIHHAAEQNLQFLETTQLTGKDLIQMLKEQNKFSSYWKGLGPKLAGLYVNRSSREREVSAIDTVIARWGRKADSSLWAGLYKEFANNKVPIDSFSNAGEFVANLSDYMDTQGGNKNAPRAEKTARLNDFLKNVWNPSVGTQWIPMLVDQGLITKDQQTQLQAKLTAWKQATKPSYVLLYIIIIILVITFVFFFLRRGRKRAVPPPPSQN